MNNSHRSGLKQSIYDLNFEDLQNLIVEWREPTYRTEQIWSGLYRHFWSRPEEFTNLPVDLRTRISSHLEFSPIKPAKIITSSDQETIKTLFHLQDGGAIEAVIMHYEHRDTLCISTQAGCAMGCVFCATGQMGFKRHLTSGEIVAQVIYYAKHLLLYGKKVTNIVLMGMGEPFHNYHATMAAIDRLNHPLGMALGARRFTISTVGLVPAILKFAEEKSQVNLAVSLHAVTDDARTAIMPVNRRYPISELIKACHIYVRKTGRRISFEWALIRGVNDDPETARHLAALLKGLNCHVNVIPLNPTQQFNGAAATQENARAFCRELEKYGIPCTVRIRRGIDIAAGCGQLATRSEEDSQT